MSDEENCEVKKVNLDFSAIAVLLLMFTLLTTAMKLLESRLPGFTARKLFHAAGGLICCYGAIICPSYREGCAAALAACAAVAAMRLVKKSGAVSFLYCGSDNESLGDILFPVSVALLAYITAIDRLTFILPVMVLSVADCLAACVGKSFGTRNLAHCGEDRKSPEGSMAFFAGAYAVCAVCLTAYSDMAAANIILISFVIALCLTMTELFSSRGTDNIMIPLTAYLLIKGLSPLSLGSLALTAGVLLLLLATSVAATGAGITTLYGALKCSVMWFSALVALRLNLTLGIAYTAAAAALTVLPDRHLMKGTFGVPLLCTVTSSVLISNAASTYISMMIIAATGIALAVMLLTKHEKRGARIEAVGNTLVARS